MSAVNAPRPPPRTKQHGQSKHTLTTFLITLVIFSVVTLVTLYPPSRSAKFRKLQRTVTRPLYALLAYAPIPDIFTPSTDLVVALHSLNAYPHTQQSVISAKWRAFHSMPSKHRKWGQSIGWKRSLKRMEECVDVNTIVTDRLSALATSEVKRLGEPISLLGGRMGKREDARVVEVLKHFVRDWSDEGASEREALYPTIFSALSTVYDHTGGLPNKTAARRPRILVPGAGLSRLAYEIAAKGYFVDANEFSHFMSLATQFIMSPNETQRVGQHTVHPYIHLPSHHRSTEKMTRAIAFPDIVPDSEVLSRLSFRHGDFMKLSAPDGPDFRGQETPPGYDAIVTMFFIDTAQSLPALFDQINTLLKPGGIWINFGPLLYYGNVAMALPLDAVLKLVQVNGFEIIEHRSVENVDYTADKEGMYSFRYNPHYWLAKKPWTASSSPAGGKEEL